MKAAIYTRISRDEEGLEKGVQRQEEDCRKWCRDHGYDVVAVYCDNDISAMGTKKRPEYERLIKGIVNRDFDAVVAWHFDRLTRSPKELEKYIDICGEEDGIPTYTLSGGKIDLSTPDGRMFARIGAIIAHYYVEHNRLNNLRAKQQAREKGLFFGKPGYGWRRVSKGVIEQVAGEADYIRQAYESFIGGKSPQAIADQLNAAGEVTRTGKPWNAVSIKQLLRIPTHAGLIEHFPDRGKKCLVYRPVSEKVYQGNWQPIVDRDVWEAAVSILSDRTRFKRRGPRYANLLSGIMVCGKCGGKTTVQRPPKDNPQYSTFYLCHNSHVTLQETPTNEYVIPIILDMISESSSARNARELTAELARIEKKRRDLAANYGSDDNLSYEEFVTAARTLRDRAEIAKARLGALQTDVNAGTREWWDKLDLETQRGLVRATADITLLPYQEYKRRSVVAERIRIEPK